MRRAGAHVVARRAALAWRRLPHTPCDAVALSLAVATRRGVADHKLRSRRSGHGSAAVPCQVCRTSVPQDHWHGHMQSRQHLFNAVTRPALESEGVAAALPPAYTDEAYARHVWCRVCDVAVEVDGHRDDAAKWRLHISGREHARRAASSSVPPPAGASGARRKSRLLTVDG